MEVKEIFKQVRTMNNLTQTQLAEILNCRRDRVADIERGKTAPNIEDIKIISKQFNVSTDYLLGLNPNPTVDEIEAKITLHTGLSNESINKLHKCWNKNGATFSNLINFLITDFNAIALLNDYFKSFIYDEIEYQEKYRYIPRSKLSFSEEITMKKIFFANLIEKLPKIREDFINTLSDAEKEEIILKYLFKSADIDYCKKTIYGDCITDTYYPTEEEQLESDAYYQSKEYQDKIFKKEAEAQEHFDKEFEYIGWFLSKYEKYKKEHNDGND